MLKGDDGVFLRQLTDLIFDQNLANAIPFFDVQDTHELRLYYEFASAGMAAFIIRWIVEGSVSKEDAAVLLADILLQGPSRLPGRLVRQ